MDNQRGKNDGELNWLAGIVEGEGSIGVNFGQKGPSIGFFPHVMLGNSDLSMMEEALRILHAHGVSGHLAHRNHLRGKLLMHHLQLTGMRRVAAFLDLLLPFMRTTNKRTDAVLAREFIQSRLSREKYHGYLEREIEIFQELRARHGRPPIIFLRDLMPSPESIASFRVKIKSSPR